MSNQRKRVEWMRDVAENQRNIVFPDTTRNLGGFWRGMDRQRLNTAQWFGVHFAAVLHCFDRRPYHEGVAGRAGIVLAEAFLRLRSISSILLAAGPIFRVDEVEDTPGHPHAQNAEVAVVEAIRPIALKIPDR